MKFLKSISLFCFIIIVLLLSAFFIIFPNVSGKIIVDDMQTEEMTSTQPSELPVSNGRNVITRDVLKNGEADEKEKIIYYIRVMDSKLYVFRSDMDEAFMPTELTLDMLPESVRQEVIAVKCFDEINEVYDFLESYTS